jgi:hypothetical protein
MCDNLIQVLGNIYLIDLLRLQVFAAILAVDPAGQRLSTLSGLMTSASSIAAT